MKLKMNKFNKWKLVWNTSMRAALNAHSTKTAFDPKCGHSSAKWASCFQHTFIFRTLFNCTVLHKSRWVEEESVIFTYSHQTVSSFITRTHQNSHRELFSLEETTKESCWWRVVLVKIDWLMHWRKWFTEDLKAKDNRNVTLNILKLNMSAGIQEPALYSFSFWISQKMTWLRNIHMAALFKWAHYKNNVNS